MRQKWYQNEYRANPGPVVGVTKLKLPVDTWRNNNVIITSKRRRNVASV